MTIKLIPLGPLAAQVARSVRLLREKQNMPKSELVRQLAQIGHPIPVLGVSRLEQGDRRVDVDDLAALASIFGVEPWSLTQPPQCDACLGSPPAGFTCNACGVTK